MIEYTKEGMKITHPTGVVQILSIADLTRLKNSETQYKEMLEQNIFKIKTHIAKIQNRNRIQCNG